MTIGDDFSNALSEMGTVFSDAYVTISYVHDGGTVSSVAALKAFLPSEPRDVDAPDAPVVDDRCRFTFLRSYLTDNSVTVHPGRDTITHGSDTWRVFSVDSKATSSLAYADCQKFTDFEES